jgi:hypothetical protein
MYKRKLYEFMVKQKSMQDFLYMIKLVHKHITFIQRWYRTVYCKKLLVIGIINTQWSTVEYEIIKGTKKQSILGSPYKIIKDNYNNGQLSNVIPIKIRLKYIRGFIQRVNRDYNIKYLDYLNKSLAIKAEFEKSISYINAHRIISGETPLTNLECPDLPLAPHKTIFMSTHIKQNRMSYIA